MECTINDINLSFDKDNRLRSTIGRVSGWSVDKAIMLAAQLQTEGFKSFLKENLLPTDIIKDTEVDINNIKDEDYVNIKQNKFGSLLNAYYLLKLIVELVGLWDLVQAMPKVLLKIMLQI